jgi:hypothetical protein
MKDPIHSIAKALYDHDVKRMISEFSSPLPELDHPENYTWGIEAKRFLVMMKAYEEFRRPMAEQMISYIPPPPEAYEEAKK